MKIYESDTSVTSCPTPLSATRISNSSPPRISLSGYLNLNCCLASLLDFIFTEFFPRRSRKLDTGKPELTTKFPACWKQAIWTPLHPFWNSSNFRRRRDAAMTPPSTTSPWRPRTVRPCNAFTLHIFTTPSFSLSLWRPHLLCHNAFILIAVTSRWWWWWWWWNCCWQWRRRLRLYLYRLYFTPCLPHILFVLFPLPCKLPIHCWYTLFPGFPPCLTSPLHPSPLSNTLSLSSPLPFPPF